MTFSLPFWQIYGYKKEIWNPFYGPTHSVQVNKKKLYLEYKTYYDRTQNGNK